MSCYPPAESPLITGGRQGINFVYRETPSLISPSVTKCFLLFLKTVSNIFCRLRIIEILVDDFWLWRVIIATIAWKWPADTALGITHGTYSIQQYYWNWKLSHT